MTIRSRPRRSRRAWGASAGHGNLRLPFGSCYVYSPHGRGALSVRSRLVCARLKGGYGSWISSYVACVGEHARHGCYAGFFGAGTVLVPVPGSQPVPPGEVGASERLARAMHGSGLAEAVWTGLRRATAVPKSSSAWPWYRPTVFEHLRSLSVEELAPERLGRLVLIDDVVTKGRTLIAAAIRIHLLWPSVPIRAFALMRTMSMGERLDRLVEPCQGEIRWNGRDAFRSP